MCKVSVIVPVYNAEKYLRECVDSILGQTLQEIEVIFVDDGSTDNSLAILEEYKAKDNRITIVKGTHHGGGAARNQGIECASGEYLSFFDSDDMMDEQMLEKLYGQMTKEDADVAICSVRFWHEATGAVSDEVCGLRIDNLPGKETFSCMDMPGRIFNTFHNWPWNKMFKRSFIMEHGIRFQEIMRTNDLLFTAKSLVLASRITTVPEYLVTYRVRLTESCQANNGLAPFDFYKAFAALKEWLEEHALYEKLRQSYVNHALDGCIANLNTSDFSDKHKEIFTRLKEEIFKELDILGHGDDYFYEMNYESKNMERYHNILACDYEGFLLYRANELNDLFHNRLYQSYHDFCVMEIQNADIIHLREEVKRLQDETQRQRDELAGQHEIILKQHEHVQSLIRDLDETRWAYEDIKGSFSYRFGYKVTAPIRAVGRLVRGKKEDSNEETVDGGSTDL